MAENKEQRKAPRLSDLEREGLADWRVELFGTLANDVPAAFPGGPSHKAGTFIYPNPTLVKHPSYNAIGFITPSPTAMALNVASVAASTAVALKTQIVFSNMVSPIGTVKSVVNETLPYLFNYFEQCMIAVTFSFQSLEAFANQIIQSRLKATYQVQRRDGTPRDLSPDELERQASTEEKLATILPDLLGVKTPKGQKLWERFVKLKRVRDSTIHLKTVDAESKLDAESLFFQFLNHNAKEFPRAALDMIDHFREGKNKPLWTQRIRENIK